MRPPDVQRATIGKERAREYLLCVNEEKQRQKNKSRVKVYCRVMNAGAWRPWVPMIAFNRKGELINGQHVLTAFVESDLKKLEITVQRNLDSDAYDAFDKNRVRSAADDLHAEGVERATQILPVASVIWQYERGLFDGLRYLNVKSGDEFPAPSEKAEIYRTHPGIVDHLHKSPSRSASYFSLGAMRAASWILHQYFPDAAPAFFRSFLQCVNIPTADHPINRLRQELLNRRKDEKALNAGKTLARIFKAFLLCQAKQPAEGALLKKNESFPDIRAGLFPDIHAEKTAAKRVM
jgi:hypothetical protein